MSKSSTASTPKTSSQLPSKSAWSKGPPANTATAPSTRPQSPAPSAAAPSAPPTHSRRSSTLGQGVAFKDGVGARNTATPTKSGSSVTFGSIDDAAAPISSSPAAVPTIKPEGIKSFGSVPASTSNGKGHSRTTSFSTGTPPSVAASTSTTPSTSTAASGSASTPKPPKFDVRSLFQKPSQDGPSASSSSADVTSPAIRSAPLPQPSLGPQGQHPPHQPQPPQMGGPYSNFRPQQNGSNAGVPRSPSFPRQMPNGNVNGRPPPTPNGPPSAGMPQAMPSPRMGPPHGGQPQPVPHGAPGAPVPVPQWGGYYYPYGMPMDPNYYPHTPQWMPQHMAPQPHTPQAPPGSLPGMPMSPRGQQPTLHPPGTPTMAPTIPPNAHPPHPTPSPHMHTSSLSSISSTPSTPASSTAPGGGLSRLNSNASSFTPKRVVIKSESGQEVDLERFKKQAPAVSSPIVPSSPARRPVSVRIETEEAKRKRIAEEEAAKRKEKEKDAEVNAKKAAEEKARRDEETRKSEEAEAQKKREEEEQRKKVEEERARKEAEEEKERLRKEKEEKERLALEAEEKARKEEEERKLREEEERAAKEAEEKAKAAASAATKPEPSEEGEVSESLDAADEAAKEEAKDKVSDKAPLRIDTSLNSDGKRRPGRLDLSSTKTNAIPAPLPSALATARIIEDIGSIEYPEGILSPKPELNMNAKQGKFRYDRDFLLQFMAVCKEKPDSLPPLDAIGLEPTDQSFAMPPRGGSQHGHNRRPSSTAMPPPSSNVSRQASVGLGISGFQKNVNPFTMGQFSTPKMSSEERFAASSRSTSVSSGPAGLPFGRPAPMVRSSSQGGPSSSGRTRSQRGGKRDKDRPDAGPSRQGNAFGSSLANSMSLEPVAPLEVSANRWTPGSLVKKGPVADQDSPEVVDRKVRSLLNKLTMERFDSISDQIIAWANRSEKEQDGRTLIQVIRLVFEKATDEATWSEMYARLCRKMMEQISPNVRDDGIKNADGKPIAGGQLFRKYLLNRCQEDFERGWVAKEATAAAAATKATEDQAAKAAADGKEDEESALYSEEYYAAQKAKRQGLGLIKFIGELFKLQMLTERIMHECVKKLLGNVENPEEEEIESLCKLLTTVGQILDTPKARAHMDVYFSRMKELCKSPNVNSRMQFMLQDIIELRERKWIPRNLAAAPTTIAALREQIEKEKAASDKDAMNRTLSMSRGGSRRGGDRNDHQQIGPDGWAVAGGPAPRQPPKAGDLSNFGKINKSTPMTFGPSSVFQKDKTKSRESTLSRQGSTNMFSMLSANPEIAAEVTSAKSSRPPSRKSSVDLGPGGAPEATPQRKRLQLLPRSVPVDGKAESTPAGSTAGSDDEGAESTSGPSMSVEEANTRISEDLKEFFSIRDLNEADVYFTKLPTEHRHLLVDKLVTRAVESKEADAQLVADLLDRAHSKNLVSPASFEEGFNPVAEIIDDIAIDAPKALNLFAIMMKGAHLHEDEERRARLTGKSMDSDKLVSLLSS
ncbi:uncharacterized protein TRAVEDRAFT_173662 [Trametes versicolor FP-101664 SS1]|uniref:uncharacterized protein n=1 Tax=Trametes versicolor (strain FP-101664) TaxID=717944 RepID=UPI0004623FA2|nr:uncharacterized protein TRAVEDRAFT_173662 [Trametes versicolor FP-101664 SS1]EIW54449.1 hypothetical protein TRAVEDRAFT_173662 [Trametes versicolor FP-101664 SS1]